MLASAVMLTLSACSGATGGPATKSPAGTSSRAPATSAATTPRTPTPTSVGQRPIDGTASPATGPADSTSVTASPETTSPAAPITAVQVAGTIATGLVTPWGLGFLPDGTALITERDTGKLLAVSPDPAHAVRTVGTVSGVMPGGEGGLLGLAVSAKGDTDPQVFVYYTSASDNRVAALTLNADATSITSQRDILAGIPKAAVHNGGRLAIHHGEIYIGTGDATNAQGAQRLDYLGGKILRITLDGKPAPGNPFPDAPLVYSYGHRNVQGLAFDPQGRLWASEFGASAYDELNLVRPGGNYGWPAVEGPSDDPKYVAPYKYWRTSQASPSGLAIIGETAFMAALRGSRLWLIPLGGSPGSTAPIAQLEGTYGRLRTVVIAPDGSMWLTTSNTDGRGTVHPGDDRILRLTTA